MNVKQKLLAAVLSLALLLSFSACADKQEYASYNYDLADYVKVGTYKGVGFEDLTYEVTAEEIQKHVLLARSNYAEAKEKTGAASLTDQVNIDYAGYMDGVAFEGGTAKDQDLTLGSGAFIDGFEDGLVGVKPGETVTLNLSFPNPYPNNPDLAGKPVQFVVTVNRIFEQVLPEYTDDFVLTYYGYESTKAFEDALRASVEEQYETQRTYNRISQVWDKVLTEAEVLQMPEAEQQAKLAEYTEYYTAKAEENGQILNEYVTETLGMTVKDFQDSLESEVSGVIKEEMVLYFIARTENIAVSAKEYEEGALEYASYYGLTTVQELEAYFSPEEITQNLLFDKVLEFLSEQAVVTSTAPMN